MGKRNLFVGALFHKFATIVIGQKQFKEKNHFIFLTSTFANKFKFTLCFIAF